MQNSLWQALLTSLRNRTSHGCHGILTIAKFAWNPELSESQSSLFCSHQINQPRSMKGWPSSQKPGRETSEAAKASNNQNQTPHTARRRLEPGKNYSRLIRIFYYRAVSSTLSSCLADDNPSSAAFGDTVSLVLRLSRQPNHGRVFRSHFLTTKSMHSQTTQNLQSL